MFLFFAQFFWPFWIPFSVAFTEPRPGVRQVLTVPAVLALEVGWALYAPLLFVPERLGIRVVRHSIRYDPVALPAFALLPGAAWQLLYLASICYPLLLAFGFWFRAVAVTLAVSGVLSHFIYWHAFESVWCFFAAALSLQLCLAFRHRPGLYQGP